MAVVEDGGAVVGTAKVEAAGSLLVNLPGHRADGTKVGGGIENAGAMVFYSIVDEGVITGDREVMGPETDDDYRMRVAVDNLLDQESFNSTVANTSKLKLEFATMTPNFTTGGLVLNTANSVAINNGISYGTWASFPVGGNQTTVCETVLGWTAQPTANVVIDFGLFIRGGANAFTPTDGVFFRLTSAGLQGVSSINGVEVTTGIFPSAGGAGVWGYASNDMHRFLIQTNNVRTTFWVDNVLLGSIKTPVASGSPTRANSLPWSIRQANVGGTAGGAIQTIVTDYRVITRGVGFADSMGDVGNRVYGSYQALSGQTPGSLATYNNNATPAAGLATNTTAVIGTGLGGQFWETLTAAPLNTDVIICSFLNPAGTVNSPGRRLKVNGVKLQSFIQTLVAGGPMMLQYSLAFGHTALSLATTESTGTSSPTVKQPRRVPLPSLMQNIANNQVAFTPMAMVGNGDEKFVNPIYVNPGEYIALVGKKFSAATLTAGVAAHEVAFDYSWE